MDINQIRLMVSCGEMMYKLCHEWDSQRCEMELLVVVGIGYIIIDMIFKILYSPRIVSIYSLWTQTLALDTIAVGFWTLKTSTNAHPFLLT